MHDAVRAERRQRLALRRRDDVVRRREHPLEPPRLGGVVENATQRSDFGERLRRGHQAPTCGRFFIDCSTASRGNSKSSSLPAKY